MTDRTYEFNWDIIGDLQEGRPNLGEEVNLVLYRLMQYTFLDVSVKKFGSEETGRLFRDAGHIAGRFFFDNFLKDHKGLPLDNFLAKLHAVLGENGIRYCRIDSVNVGTEEFSFSVATGIEGVGQDLLEINDYQYDVGFAEGILFKYTGKKFKPGTVNVDTVQEILPKLGDQINLVPYRMLQYTVRDVIEQKIGTEACNQLFYDAGDVAGHFFFDNFMAEFKDLPLNGFVGELQRILKDLKVGILRVEKADPEKGQFTLTVSEDLDCSGLPDLGIEVCNYDEGLIAGIFYKYTGITFNVKEVDCWSSGDRTCRFAVNRA
ncbi:MAG: 4-vinyl reductase [Betaproteobacteria bacterium]|nr:4-vinyl reductase [Betaproteobacteria bacterium]